ncbi:pleckstrin homology domain-containing family G member 4B-like [Chironomus tepperi]|uniref:pleckstrin homology domain-containing family G member 4B-like n=1 Tax=Chironomus tepperi TaxID=113505 RepID=UPI00391EFB09
MSDIGRDSGIIADDESSETSSMRACDDCSKMSYVQKLRKRFEILSAGKESGYHSSCNWWLDDEEHEVDEGNDENSEEPADSIQDTQIIDDNESKLQQQMSVISERSLKSQKSHQSLKSQHSEVNDVTPIHLPLITFTKYTDQQADDEDSFESADDLDEEIEPQFVRKSEMKITISRPTSITSQLSNLSTSKLFNIIRELQENEENYVRSLKNGIVNYMTVMNRRELPKTLRGQKHRVFGNIESIYKFHCNEFYPKLVECGEDVELIAELFTSYVTRDYFYGYIIYAINRKRSELLCNYHVHYWKQIQNQCGDRLGINSFLLQPIQRLPRYQLLLNEIIKELSKDIENTKQSIAACCVAEKNIQRLLDTVNESMSINDVRNCYDMDILSQGKFKKMNEFEMYDWELRRKYRGKVFLFERCVVYTEALDREHLEYRGHYESDKLGIIYKEGKSKFKLFAKKRGCKEVEFYADLNTVVEWKSAITGMLMDFVAAEKKRNIMNTIRRSSSTKYRSIPDSLRSSILSNTSNQSNFSVGSSYRSSTSSARSSTNEQPRQSHWYI